MPQAFCARKNQAIKSWVFDVRIQDIVCRMGFGNANAACADDVADGLTSPNASLFNLCVEHFGKNLWANSSGRQEVHGGLNYRRNLGSSETPELSWCPAHVTARARSSLVRFCRICFTLRDHPGGLPRRVRRR